MTSKYLLIGVLVLGTALGVWYLWRGVPVASQTSLSDSPTHNQESTIQPSQAKTIDTSGFLAKPNMYTSAPVMTIDPKKKYVATLVTGKGSMRIGLFASEAPNTVNNFVFLAREGFYSNTIFHRVMKGFMIQGGDPTGTGTGSPGYRFDDEKITRDYKRGIIAMANSGPNTNGSQFFIMHADYPLPKSYVIFGIIDATDPESLKTLDGIADIDVENNGNGEMSQPVQPILLQSVTITER